MERIKNCIFVLSTLDLRGDKGNQESMAVLGQKLPFGKWLIFTLFQSSLKQKRSWKQSYFPNNICEGQPEQSLIIPLSVRQLIAF